MRAAASASARRRMTAAGNRADAPDAMNGNAVMYEPNYKVFTAGGALGGVAASVLEPCSHRDFGRTVLTQLC